MFVISGTPEITLTSGETLTTYRFGPRTVTVRTALTKRGKIRLSINDVPRLVHPLALERVLSQELSKYTY